MRTAKPFVRPTPPMPTFATIAPDTTELRGSQRNLSVILHVPSGDVTLATFDGRDYTSRRLTAAEARALGTELLRLTPNVTATGSRA